jgi:pyruvate dehydrogenase E1 component beta subunit
MVLSALEDPDPVFIFEHATLYPLEDDVDDDPQPVDIDRAAVRRTGADVTLVTYGGSVGKCLDAAEQLSAEGIEAEVVDLRTLRPLDITTVLDSLAKTHRAVIVDEGWRTGSLAGEISAQLLELGFDLLDWPVQRVCSAEVPIPYAKHLEDAALPSADRVMAVVREIGI